jgi:hypothetical protein
VNSAFPVISASHDLSVGSVWGFQEAPPRVIWVLAARGSAHLKWAHGRPPLPGRLARQMPTVFSYDPEELDLDGGYTANDIIYALDLRAGTYLLEQ